MTACKFIFFGATIEEYSKAYSAITGIESSGQDLLKTGEQIYYNERIMNFKNGFTRKDDDLPNRFFEFGGTGAIQYKMLPIVRKDFLNALENYYKIRGLDENGSPIEEKAKALGLSWEI
jgi:aldehyde:ferredoxin oxidoreductase